MPKDQLPPEFVAQQQQPIGEMPDEPLARKPLAVKVGQSVHDAVVSLNQRDRITWLRRVITEAAQRELMDN